MAMKPKPQSKAKAKNIAQTNRLKRIGKPQDNGRTTSIKKIDGKSKAVTFANNTNQESISRAVPLRAMSAAQRANAAAKKAAVKKGAEGPKRTVRSVAKRTAMARKKK